MKGLPIIAAVGVLAGVGYLAGFSGLVKWQTEDPIFHSAPQEADDLVSMEMAENAADEPAPAPAPKPVKQPQPKVDETALRYFASQGDTKRLQAEIARLRALYPQWTPPTDPLAAPAQQDEALDAMWKLYSEGKFAEVRKAIADRQTAEPAWVAPDDLLDRLAVAEAREQLVNASNVKQYETVVRIGSANPSLLTCGDVDVLWRVAEAFALTQKPERAKDAYLYVLTNCNDTAERLATVQKAMPLLSRANLDLLLATERTGADGAGEFAVIRPDLARQSVANGNADPKLVVAPADLATVEKLAAEKGLAADALLLGWYHVQRNNPKLAESWFRKALEKENSASASQGLALALIDQDRPTEAEAVLYEWRDTSDDTKAVYLAATANLLAVTPPVPISAEVLNRIVPVIVAERDAVSAQQLGWYADGMNQFQTAAQWFTTALGWKPDDEPSAYGLALMRWKLGDDAGVAEMQRAWAGRSERIAIVGQPEPLENGKDRTQTRVPPAFQPAPLTAQPALPALEPAQRVVEPVARQPQPVVIEAPAASEAAVGTRARLPRQAQAAPREETAAPRQAEQRPAEPRQRATRQQRVAGCTTTLDPETMAPDAALSRAWCLMDINRPVEAAAAFEVGLRSSSAKARQDAAYGQSLAYLRAGLSSKAAVAATKAPMERKRTLELQTALLETQATGAFEAGRYVETLLALDERARIAPERVDLLVLRGYAYLELRRYDDAARVFRAAAGTGSREGVKGLSVVKEARNAGVYPKGE